MSLGLLLLVYACGEAAGPANARRKSQLVASGQHEARTATAGSQATLSLKSGFSVLLRPIDVAGDVRPALLRVAEPRAPSGQIAAGFVPVGPTVALSVPSARVEASFVADGFRVRAGHRLVLAVERERPCQGTARCLAWQLVEGSYRDGRCTALLVAPLSRMQFGSLPVEALGSASEPRTDTVNDSAAP